MGPTTNLTCGYSLRGSERGSEGQTDIQRVIWEIESKEGMGQGDCERRILYIEGYRDNVYEKEWEIHNTSLPRCISSTFLCLFMILMHWYRTLLQKNRQINTVCHGNTMHYMKQMVQV